jgi:tetratricopeptide (TPR) repeat protein
VPLGVRERNLKDLEAKSLIVCRRNLPPSSPFLPLRIQELDQPGERLDQSDSNIQSSGAVTEDTSLSSYFSINQPIHIWSRIRLESAAQRSIVQGAFWLLTQMIEELSRTKDRLHIEQLVPHVRSCLEWLDMIDYQAVPIDWPILANFCLEFGLLQAAEKLYKISLSKLAKEEKWPDTTYNLVQLRINLAAVYVKQSRLGPPNVSDPELPEQSHLEPVTKMRTRTSHNKLTGPSSASNSELSPLFSSTILAHVDNAETQYNLALKDLATAKEEGVSENTDSPRIHRLELTILAEMASLYKAQGRLEDAEVLYYAIHSDFDDVWGADDPHTLQLLERFSMILFEQEKYEEAEALYKKTLAAYVRRYGRDHPMATKMKLALANTARLLGQYRRAESLFKEVLAATKSVFGEKHPATVKIMASLATLDASRGRYGFAAKQYTEILALQKELLGEDHPATLNVVENLALSYQALENWTQAEKLYKQALKGRKSLGDSEAHERKILCRLLEVYQGSGKQEEADNILKTIKSLRSEAVGLN